MNNTHDPATSPDEAADAGLAALENADPADAPEIAEELADTLTAALDAEAPTETENETAEGEAPN